MKSYEQYCNIYLESAFFFSVENKEVKKVQNVLIRFLFET